MKTLRESKIIWLISLFLFIFYTLIHPILLHASTPICQAPGSFDPNNGYCVTEPIDQFGKCPDLYIYDSVSKKCISYPQCVGEYVYNISTKRCEPISVTPIGGEILNLESNWCALDLNNDGEIDDRNEFAYCVNTPQGNLCPLGMTRCNISTKVPNCPSPYVYNNATGKCEYTPTQMPCPAGGTFNTSTRKCELNPTFVCPSGSTEIGANQCVSCPFSNSPCMYYNNEWVCSPGKCVTEAQVQDDSTDLIPGGYEDDTGIDEHGSCLGDIYIFNGKRMRCRPSGLKTGFQNCCNKAQGRLYDSTGSTGMLLGDAIKAAYISLELVKQARLLSQVKEFMLVKTGGQVTAVHLLDSQGKLIKALSDTKEIKVWEALSKKGLPPSPRLGDSYKFDFSSDYSKYVTSYLETMSPQLVSQIAVMALTRAIDDPILSAAVDLVAQSIFAYLGWVSPWTIALSALNLVLALFSGGCDEQDILTSTYKESGYCHYIGSKCIKKLPLVGCVQKVKIYCCFNSKLARIIHEQGRPQLTTFGPSGGWGSVDSPNCRGFTPEEFQSIDFGKIDFSEYVADIQNRVRQNIEPQMLDIFQKSMQNVH